MVFDGFLNSVCRDSKLRGQLCKGFDFDKPTFGHAFFHFFLCAHFGNHGLIEDGKGRFHPSLDLSHGNNIATLHFIHKTFAQLIDIDDAVARATEWIDGRCIENTRFRFRIGVKLDKGQLHSVSAPTAWA